MTGATTPLETCRQEDHMRTETGKAVRLADYRVPDFLVDRVELDVSLHPSRTRVTSRLHIRPNPDGQPGAALALDGDGLTVEAVDLDGAPLSAQDARIEADGLTLHNPPNRPFILTTTTSIDATGNTQLSGLYRSRGVYCTQCEAEGFRRITYFPDRPDVLSIYETRIEADCQDAPVLLGNGNLVESGDAGAGRHFARWFDPFPKPSYLFALVGGDLAALRDTFTTASSREVKLAIHVEPGKESRAEYAMDALRRAMRWDEEKYGREYDLDVFNIVAVSDFNMGAMENKGLNIFNDKYILASPETATDADYAGIETVVAHEYFHNWTGNRITCRDWFQLCLKEGLTVFRDQEFSADQRSAAVRRIQDVRALRSAQFSEDAGPLAHNVRPHVYHEINNFYTATVYQKGAEVIRVLKTLIGEQAFRSGMDIYFDRYDGTAATVEDFISCFEAASGRNLDQFMRWYEQSGTPEVAATGEHDPARQTFTLHLRQILPATPGQATKQPQVIPVHIGLVGASGKEIALACDHTDANHPVTDAELTSGVFELNGDERTLVFTHVPEAPIPSILRGFSAPVRLTIDYSDTDLMTLIAHDSDPFNRWQAAQSYATKLLKVTTQSVRAGNGAPDFSGFCSAMAPILMDFDKDMEFSALALTLPSEADVAREIGQDIDPEAIFIARTLLKEALGHSHFDALQRIYRTLSSSNGFALDARSAGRRALRGTTLSLIAATDQTAGRMLARAQFDTAATMTDTMSALGVLSLIAGQDREDTLRRFRQAYAEDTLVIDKWFAIQAVIPDTQAPARVRALMSHPDFSLTNPNRLRALVASFAFSNQRGFNKADGEGYRLVAEVVRELDPQNPQVAARLLTAFRNWRSLETGRQALAGQALRDIAAAPALSADVRDIVTRSLG